jgi:hypothetical protein
MLSAISLLQNSLQMWRFTAADCGAATLQLNKPSTKAAAIVVRIGNYLFAPVLLW